MFRLFIIISLFFTVAATAQTKKPLPAKINNAKAAAVKDSIRKDSIKNAQVEDVKIPKEFAVYTKRPKGKERMKLCVNLVSDTTILNYCVNDSVCKFPEVSKILFEKKQGDSTYVLVYVRAFSKAVDKPECDAGKEVKLFFARWNTKTNKAIVKQKNVESCMKGITNMTKESIDDWDKASPLIFKYYKGAQNFMELKFDPQNYLLGFQSSGDN